MYLPLKIMALVLFGFGIFMCFVVFTYVFSYYVHLKPVSCSNNVQLNGKTAIITGGTAGIGYETALQLACRGARVVIASRNALKGELAARKIIESTGNSQVFFVPLDLRDLSSVKTFCDNIIGTEVKLDILINNAAISYHKENRTIYGHDSVFATNYLGHFLLTFLLLDLLRKSAPSRIINVSSVAHAYMNASLNFTIKDEKFGDIMYPHLEGYDASKLAQVLHVKELTRVLSGSGVTANAVHPGLVLTKLWDDMNLFYYQKIASLAKLIVKPLAMSARDACQTTVHCATSPDVECMSGKYFKHCQVATEAAAAKNPEFAKQLWDISKVLCGITDNGTLVVESPHIRYEDEEMYAKRSTRVWKGEVKPTLMPHEMVVERT